MLHNPLKLKPDRSSLFFHEHYWRREFPENGFATCRQLRRWSKNHATIDNSGFSPDKNKAGYLKRALSDYDVKDLNRPDEYFAFLAAYERQDAAQKLANPVWHIHHGNPPKVDMPVTFALLLNLVSASNAHDKDVLWGFISRHQPGVSPATHPKLDELVGYAIRYFDDFVKPNKKFRAPDSVERDTLAKLSGSLAALPSGADGDAIQNAALDVARGIERYQDHAKKSPEGGPGVSVAFFQMIYEVLIGQERGPRFGSFAALFGIDRTRDLIAKAIKGELA